MEFCNKGTLSCHFQLVRHNLHNLKPYLYLNQSINQLGTIVEQGLEPCTWNLSTISFTKRLTPANTFLAIHENRHTTVSNHIFRAMRCTILCDITGNRLLRICTSHNNDFPQRVTPLTGSFIALLIQWLVPNQSVVVLCLSVYLFRHSLIVFLTAQAPWDRHPNYQVWLLYGLLVSKLRNDHHSSPYSLTPNAALRGKYHRTVSHRP